MDYRASISDGQGDWVDVQTLYASDRYTPRRQTGPPFASQYFCFFKEV